MTVSIIVCTHNRATHLQETLKALGAVAVPASLNAEIVVVDNASTDETPALVKSTSLPHLPVRYVSEPRKGKGYAYNTGMAAAKGDYFLFTDDDVRPPENWIERMMAPLLANQADAVAGGVRLAPHLIRPWMTPIHQGWLAATTTLDTRNPSEMIGANMAFSRRVLSQVPAFDVELGPGALGLGDESLFCFQLLEAGFRLKAVPEVEVEHHFEPSRLTRDAFLKAAVTRGKVEAYVAWHWRHFSMKNAPIRIFRRRLELAVLRIIRQKEITPEEGMPLWEMERVLKLAFCKQYLIVSQKTPNYDLHGLVKIRGVLP